MFHPGKKAVDFYEKGEEIKGTLPVVAINTAMEQEVKPMLLPLLSLMDMINLALIHLMSIQHIQLMIQSLH